MPEGSVEFNKSAFGKFAGTGRRNEKAAAGFPARPSLRLRRKSVQSGDGCEIHRRRLNHTEPIDGWQPRFFFAASAARHFCHPDHEVRVIFSTHSQLQKPVRHRFKQRSPLLKARSAMAPLNWSTGPASPPPLGRRLMSRVVFYRCPLEADTSPGISRGQSTTPHRITHGDVCQTRVGQSPLPRSHILDALLHGRRCSASTVVSASRD